ncbi:MAG: helix-hairpin-helix domain-containing protein [Monoglobaceae bacterium]
MIFETERLILCPWRKSDAEELYKYASNPDVGPIAGCIHLIWCGYYDGNGKSKRVQGKCGFTYHHTNYDVPCALMGDIRTEHITCLTKEVWQKKHRYKDLKTIHGVGKDMEQHFFDVGIHTIDDLNGADPEELYEKAFIIKGCSIDTRVSLTNTVS